MADQLVDTQEERDERARVIAGAVRALRAHPIETGEGPETWLVLVALSSHGITVTTSPTLHPADARELLRVVGEALVADVPLERVEVPRG